MTNKTLLFILLNLFVLFVATKTREWKHCYKEDASPDVSVQHAKATLLGNNVRLDLHAKLNKPISSGYYQFEIWYSKTGSEIHYKGPFDICCGFITNSTCSQTKKSDCPLHNSFTASVQKPVHKNDPGMYEATLRIFDEKKNELVCVDCPFVQVEKKPESQQQASNQEKFLPAP